MPKKAAASTKTEKKDTASTETTKKFRVNAKNIFLTYPRCDLTTEYLRDAILKITGLTILWMVIASELHEDGGQHLHAQIEFDKKKNIRNERYFDVDAFHPNISASRNIKAVGEYVMKGGEYILHGITEEEFHKRVDTDKSLTTESVDERASRVLAASTYREGIDLAKRLTPALWLINSDKIEMTLRKQYEHRLHEYSTPPHVHIV